MGIERPYTDALSFSCGSCFLWSYTTIYY